MREYLKGFFEGNLEIDTSSWHAKLYNYWRGHAKYKTAGYRENLCHYVRVVLFWAPRAWLWHGRMPVLKVPMRYITSLWLLAIGLTLGFMLFPAVTLWVAIGLGVIGLGFGLLIGGFRAYDSDPVRGQAVLRKLAFPFQRIGRAIAAWSERHENRFKQLLDWFWGLPALTMLVAGVATWAYLDLMKLLEALLLIVGITGAIALIVGFFILGDAVIEIRKKRQDQRTHYGRIQPPPSRAHRVVKGGVGTIKVAGGFVAAKKKGICPFISFKRETNQQAA